MKLKNFLRFTVLLIFCETLDLNLDFFRKCGIL